MFGKVYKQLKTQSYNRRYLAVLTVGSCASPTYNIFGSFNSAVKVFNGVFFFPIKIQLNTGVQLPRTALSYQA